MSEAITLSPQQRQVMDQCRVVKALAEIVAGVHDDYVALLSRGDVPFPLEITGQRTAAFMEWLGHMLNAMDASTEEDDWMVPIFEEAQRLWPNAGRD